jgi:WD40 repeat protein
MAKKKGYKAQSGATHVPDQTSVTLTLNSVIFSSEHSVENIYFQNQTWIFQTTNEVLVYDKNFTFQFNINKKIKNILPISKEMILLVSTTQIFLWSLETNKQLDVVELRSFGAIYRKSKQKIYLFPIQINNFNVYTFSVKDGKLKEISKDSVQIILAPFFSIKSIFNHLVDSKAVVLLQSQVLILDLDTFQVTDFSNEKKPIFDLFLFENRIIIVESYLYNIYQNDMNTSSLLFTIKNDPPKSMMEMEDYIVTGGAQNLKFWSKSNNKCAKTIKVHDLQVTGIMFVDGKFITSSMDGSVKLWNFTNQLTTIFIHFTEYKKIMRKNSDISFHFV